MTDKSPDAVARALKGAVAQDPSPWASTLMERVEQLTHPTYISAVLDGLEQAVSEGATDLPWDNIVAGLELVVTEPWPVEPLSDTGYYESTWRNACNNATRLLRTALDQDEPLSELLEPVYGVLVTQMRKRDEVTGIDFSEANVRDGLTAAINKPSTVALEALYSLFLYARRANAGGDWGERFAEALEEELALQGEEGVLSAHLMAPRMAQFIALYGDDANFMVKIFGETEPDSMRIDVFETLLAFGSPQNSAFLEVLRDRLMAYLAASGRSEETQREAATWVVVGYIWGTAGYELDDILGPLRTANAFSDAAEGYGRVLRNTTELSSDKLAQALAFWDHALAVQGLGPEELMGFGWWSETDIQDDDWLDRMHRTLTLSRGVIDWDHEVVKRLAMIPSSKALHSLELLVTGAQNPWTVRYWEDDLRQALEEASAHPELDEARRDLVEAVLGKQLYDFRSYLPS